MTNRRRKLWITTAGLFLLLALVVGTSSIWICWALRPTLARFGVRFTSYERVGQDRLILRNVRIATNGFDFHAREVIVLQPGALLRDRYLTPRRDRDFSLSVADWTARIQEKEKKNAPKNSSLHRLLTNVPSRTVLLDRWIPSVRFANGTIDVKGHQFELPLLARSNAVVTGTVSSARFRQSVKFRASMLTDETLASFQVAPAGVSLEISLKTGQTNVALRGSLEWMTNQVKIAAAFGDRDWTPAQAEVSAPNFTLPASLAKLEGYESILGNLSATWLTNRFSFALSADALPVPASATLLSAFHVALNVNGSTNEVRVEQLRVTAPWLVAELSDPAIFNAKGDLLSQQADLVVAADLSRQTLVPGTGQLKGRATIRPARDRYPSITFAVSGTDLELLKFSASALSSAGDVQWPWVQVKNLAMQLDQGPQVSGRVKVNAAAQIISGGHLRIAGAPPRKFLPPNISYTNGVAEIDFDGPFARVNHQGSFALQGVTLPGLQPADLKANWTGKQLALEEFVVQATVTDATLALSGAAAISRTNVHLHLGGLELSRSRATQLKLVESAELEWTRLSGNLPSWKVSPLRLAGPAGEIVIDSSGRWPRQGELNLSVSNVSSRLLAGILMTAPPETSVRQLMLRGGWTNQPVRAELIADFETRLSGETLATTAHFQLGEAGLAITNLAVGSERADILRAAGLFPLNLDFQRRSPGVAVMPEGRLSASGSTVPNTAFWSKVSAWTGLTLVDPEITFSVEGSVSDPSGVIRAKAAALQVPSLKGRWFPRVTELEADVSLNQARLQIPTARFKVENQTVALSASIPIDPDWTKPWRKAIDWQKAVGKLTVESASIAAFTGLAPGVISPLGTAKINVALRPGFNMDGIIQVTGAATIPMEPVGALQDIEARVRLAGHAIEIENIRGLLGGEAISISGRVDLDHETPSGWPGAVLKLTGTNVPLARQAEIVLRSDLDLSVSNMAEKQVLVSGTVNLRDGVYLGDLKALIPGKVSSPKKRPPYFSIQTEPMADWKLRVKVAGDRFLKVRSPLFRGEVSANLRLEGTLREPLAIGDAHINSGIIQFPFANLRVNQGLLLLSSENPYEPQLLISAGSRSFGYDVKLDITGPADKPLVEFGSSPSLTSEQVIVMVTTGELPREQVRFSDQQKATKLALFLGKSLVSKFSSGEGNPERLTITSGENVSSRGRETYSLEYRLSDKWSIVGEYDRFSAVNAGIKWRLYSK